MKQKIFYAILFLFISNFAFSQVVDQEPWEPEMFNILIGLVIGGIAGYLIGKGKKA
ncbi:MAG: hypothetical protein V4683_07845 [Bacteroidota bacterium]